MEAQMGGDPAKIEAAQRRLGQAERGLARSKFGVEEAAIAVRDAERQLAEIRGDSESTADDIRKAEIALAEAQFNVADSQDSVYQETLDLEEARRNLRIATEGLRQGDEELVPFQDAVTEAQLRSKEAAEELAEAIKEQAEALQEYSAALASLDQVRQMFPKIAAANPVEGLIPATPTPTGVPAGAAGQMMMPDKIEITVNSSIVNSAQVGQEIADYLESYTRVAGPLGNYVAI